MRPPEALYDLTLEALDLGDRICCAFKYSTDLFDAVTMERMAGHFGTLVEAMVVGHAETKEAA